MRAEIGFGITGYDRKGSNALLDYRRDKAEEAENAAAADSVRPSPRPPPRHILPSPPAVWRRLTRLGWRSPRWCTTRRSTGRSRRRSGT